MIWKLEKELENCIFIIVFIVMEINSNKQNKKFKNVKSLIKVEIRMINCSPFCSSFRKILITIPQKSITTTLQLSR